MMRRDIDKNMEMDGEEIVHTPMGTTTKPAPKPIKIGVHVKYKGEEYLVQSLKENDEIFIAMGDESHIVKKSDVEVIE